MKKMARTAPTTDEGDKDYTVYADKEITEVMKDFHDWLQKNVGVKLDLRSVALGGTLRMEYQKWARENGSTRTRAASGTAKPPAKAPAKSATKSNVKSTAKPAAATTTKATRGKPAAAAAPKPAGKPASGRRGKVAATEDAPY